MVASKGHTPFYLFLFSLATQLLLSCDLTATFLLLSCDLAAWLPRQAVCVDRQARLFYLQTTWTPINNRQSVLPGLYSIAMKFFAVFTFILECSASLAVLPSYSLAIRNNAVTQDEIIDNYFNLGLTATEITLFLVSVHGIGISLRQLKRILRRLKCTRRRRRIHVVSRQCNLTRRLTWPTQVERQLIRKKVARKSQLSRKKVASHKKVATKSQESSS